MVNVGTVYIQNTSPAGAVQWVFSELVSRTEKWVRPAVHVDGFYCHFRIAPAPSSSPNSIEGYHVKPMTEIPDFSRDRCTRHFFVCARGAS